MEENQEKPRFRILSGPVTAVEKELNEICTIGYRPMPGSLAKEPHGGPVTIVCEDHLPGVLFDRSKRAGPPVNEPEKPPRKIVEDDGEPTVVSPGDADSPAVDPDVVKALSGPIGTAHAKEGDSPHGKGGAKGHVGHDAGSVVGHPKKK